MLILINIPIQDMELDLILVHFFSIPNFDWGKTAIIFGVDMSSSVHANNKKKILTLVKEQTRELDNTSLTEEAEILY